MKNQNIGLSTKNNLPLTQPFGLLAFMTFVFMTFSFYTLISLTQTLKAEAASSTHWEFEFTTPQKESFKIIVKAPIDDQQSAFNKAALECGSKMMNSKSISDEKTMDIIDTCANPKVVRI